MASFHNERDPIVAFPDSRKPTHGSSRQRQYSPHVGHLTAIRFTVRSFLQWSPSCLCYQFTDPGEMDGWVDCACPGN